MSVNTQEKKPIVATLVQIVAVMFLLGHFGAVGGALPGQVPLQTTIGTIIVSFFAVLASAWVFSGISSRKFKSRLPVSLFLWGVIFVYPLMNILRAVGYYAPKPYIPDEQLLGAAVYELLRYLVPLGLVVWVGCSAKIRAYFATPDEGVV